MHVIRAPHGDAASERMLPAVSVEGPAPAPAGAGAAPVAWVALADAGLGRAVAQALAARGFHLALVTSGARDVEDALAGRLGPVSWPQLLVANVRYADGDAFGLIRQMGGMLAPPGLALVTSQQRTVIRAACSLADDRGLRVVSVTELPGTPEDIAEAAQRGLKGAATPMHMRAAGDPLGRPALQALLDAHRIEPFFQPKVRVDSGEVIGFETLMRAIDPRGALITPDRLIAPLHDHGLLGAATLHIARRTVDFVGDCLRRGMGLSASINVSLSLMSDRAFCRALQSLVDASGVDPSWITLEITETDAMSDLSSVIEQTGRIRMYGFNLSIDDFGTGYSSFLQLSQIPFSELKIERAFVSNIDADATKRAIVGACALLGRELGLTVVAEGVETASELCSVKLAGCGMAQGFLIARPMPAPQATRWLVDLAARGHGDELIWPPLPG